MSDTKLVKQGAEARLFVSTYLGKPTLIKERFVKNYRHPDLDTAITKERIKNEARTIVRAKTAEVRTPGLYLVDFNRRRIYMEYFENSITVKDFIINKITTGEVNKDTSLTQIAKLMGQTVRKLHENNIIHGDLTTSNMLLINKEIGSGDSESEQQIVMIDFGLSYIESRAEDKGVDLYVLERALISTHNDYPDLFKMIMDHYKSHSKSNIKEILSKFEDVRARGRKRTMVG